MAVQMSAKVVAPKDSAAILCDSGLWRTPQARVPKQASVLAMDGSYEVSEKLSRPTDLQRICWAVSFSIKLIVPPQCGHNQL